MRFPFFFIVPTGELKLSTLLASKGANNRRERLSHCTICSNKQLFKTRVPEACFHCYVRQRMVPDPLLDLNVNYSPPRMPKNVLYKRFKRQLPELKGQAHRPCCISWFYVPSLCLLSKPHGDGAVCNRLPQGELRLEG